MIAHAYSCLLSWFTLLVDSLNLPAKLGMYQRYSSLALQYQQIILCLLFCIFGFLHYYIIFPYHKFMPRLGSLNFLTINFLSQRFFKNNIKIDFQNASILVILHSIANLV